MPKKDFSSAAKINNEEIVSSKDLVPKEHNSPLSLDSYVVYFPESASTVRKIDFKNCFGVGCDEVSLQCMKTVEGLLDDAAKTRGKALSVTTVITYSDRIVREFLPYCAFQSKVMGHEIKLAHIDRGFIDSYIRMLESSGVGYTTQKQTYTCTKSILSDMSRRGLLDGNVFPKNPYPNSNRRKKGEDGYTKKEFSRIIAALKSEMSRIIKIKDALLSRDLAYCGVVIAARTGINLTPLAELPVDCTLPHPLRTDRSILVTYKRRKHDVNIQAHPKARQIDSFVVVLPDVASIIKFVRDKNSSVRESSPWPTRLFVSIRPLADVSKRMPARMTSNTMNRALEELVVKYSLKTDSGDKLRLNFMRLRKTFTNRIWELSDGDPFVAAALAGNTPKVLNDSYLEPPEDAERNWALMGEIRNESLLNPQGSNIIARENTPVAGCRDTMYGQFAPKNGKHCIDFLNCFRCKAFVVTGDDLYRLFSLYWLLVRERVRIGAKKWSRLYRHIIKIIDFDIAPQFDKRNVEEIRVKAKSDPHPFWKDHESLEFAL